MYRSRWLDWASGASWVHYSRSLSSLRATQFSPRLRGRGSCCPFDQLLAERLAFHANLKSVSPTALIWSRPASLMWPRRDRPLPVSLSVEISMGSRECTKTPKSVMVQMNVHFPYDTCHRSWAMPLVGATDYTYITRDLEVAGPHLHPQFPGTGED